MRARARFFVGLFLILVLAPAFAESTAWVLYTHPDKLMSVRFPEKPTETEQDTPSAIGNIHFKLAMFAGADRVYLATAIVYPIKTKFDVSKALDGARDQALANVKGKATSEKAIKLDGFAGREVRFEAPGPNAQQRIRGVLKMFASAKPPSAFIASALRTSDKPDPDSQKFLDSMHLGSKVETQ